MRKALLENTVSFAHEEPVDVVVVHEVGVPDGDDVVVSS
jgi:hypothetical protein